jgi:hypothetical protein
MLPSSSGIKLWVDAQATNPSGGKGDPPDDDAQATNPSGGKGDPPDDEVLVGCVSTMEGLVSLICRNMLHVLCVCVCVCVGLFDV